MWYLHFLIIIVVMLLMIQGCKHPIKGGRIENDVTNCEVHKGHNCLRFGDDNYGGSVELLKRTLNKIVNRVVIHSIIE